MKKHITLIVATIIAGVLSVSSCTKEQRPSSNQNPEVPPACNAQESAIAGKWKLGRTEIYEVTGMDSAGQYTGPLISSTNWSTPCSIEFKKEYLWQQYGSGYLAQGTVGGCDSNAIFTWNIKQANKLEIWSGTFYSISQLETDSLTLSYFHQQDVLKLMEVYYYKK